MTRVRTSFACLLLALTAACGSTVQQTATVATDQGGGLDQQQALAQQDGGSTGAVAPGTAAVPGDALVPGATAPGATRSTTGPAAASRSATTGTVTPGAAAATAAPQAVAPTGRGWDRKFVYRGVVTEKDAQKAFGAVGANVDPGDTEAQATAVANDLNARGGILGRQVKVLFKDVATVNTATNPTQVGAEVCTYFAEDHPVVAVFSVVTVMDYQPFRACLAKNRIPLFSASLKAVDNQAANSLAPYFYQSVAASWDALAPVLVSRLQAQGWFGGWNARLGQAGSGRAKVGVLVDGSDVGTRLGVIMKRALKAAGYGDALVYQYQDASQGQSSSVQYFNGNGVTHVIVTDVELTAFQNSAANQQYKPRYGITSYNDPYTNLEAGGLTPAGANNGALGVGWAPGFDVSAANDPGATPGAAACLKVMAKGGQSFSGKRLAQAIAYAVCDSLNLVARGAKAGGGFSGAAIAQGIVASRSTFSPANGFSAALTADKHFVPGSVRDLGWVSSCSCFRYATATTPL